MYEWIFYIGIGVVLFTSWGIGANDCANSFATSVGAKVLSLKQAVIIAAIFEFLGAFLMGSHVTDTVRKKIVDINVFIDDPYMLMFGMLTSDLAAGIWLFIATKFKLPVSTTHSTIGAIIGFALAASGTNGVNTGKIIEIIISWVTSPFISGVITFILFTLVKHCALKKPNPKSALFKIFPLLIGLTIFINSFFIIYKGTPALGLQDTELWIGIVASLSIAIVTSILSILAIPYLKKKLSNEIEITIPPISSLDNISIDITDENREQKVIELREHVKTLNTEIKNNKIKVIHSTAEVYDKKAEKLCSYLQVFTACFSAFAHGANDVANAIGPFCTIYAVYATGVISKKTVVPIWILAIGGVGIVCGLAMWGYKIIDRIGKEITKVSPSRGCSIELGAATTVVVASRIGIPVSTTHCQIGSVVGCGLANGKNNINWKTMGHIVLSWIVTLPITALISATIFSFGYYSPSY